MESFNIGTIKFFQSFSNPLFDQVFQWITMMGEEYFQVILLTMIYWCINKEFGYKVGFACLFSGMVNNMVKETFKVPRPFGKEGIFTIRPETATGFSFPSGHTQGTTTIWASLMIKVKKRWMYGLGGAVILLVGISRIYLGCHTPTDVVGAIFFGILCLFISNWLFEYVNHSKRKWLLLVLVIPALIGALFFSEHDYYKALGFFTSFIVGYLIESSYIHFNENTTLKNQVLKYVMGVGVLVGLKYILKLIIPGSPLGEFSRYFILGLWVTVFAPLLFKLLFKAKAGADGKLHVNA
ncbi:MAG: phosphatase PAP2 family protein [Clostridia bacterium]|nr:phosphatase PAP2 family protein [Clostridia bacterium]